jgi:hypothetical protein
MNELRLRPEASAPALRCTHAYEITVDQDIFGIWIAELAYVQAAQIMAATSIA